MAELRDEVLGRAERAIRRGELGEAVELLQGWVGEHPDDVRAVTWLAAVRDLADPPGSAPLPVRSAPVRPAAAPMPAWPEDPVARLELLLARVRAAGRR